MDVNGCFVEWKKKYTALVVLDKKDWWVHVQQDHRKRLPPFVCYNLN